MAEPIPLPIPSLRTDRVVVYCMSCGNRTWTASYVIEAAFGCLPYGLLTGRLHCKTGCGDRFGVVLPLDAPTPRQWVVKYGHPPPPPAAERPAPKLNELRGSLVEIGPGGSFAFTHAMANDDAILHWGFDHLLAKLSENGRQPPRLAVTRGAQWSRDSKRDFKVVKMDYIEHGDLPPGSIGTTHDLRPPGFGEKPDGNE